MPSNHRNNARRGARRGTASSSRVTSNPAKGDGKTLELLNLVLKNELTAINQYFLHSRMLANWGISELSKKEYDESVDEMKHADTLIQRILFLGGLPNLQYLDKLLIGENTEEIIACDLKFEYRALADLRGAIAYSEEVRDYGSRLIYEAILKNEEEHIDYLETQQKLIATIGLADYVQMQTSANAANALDPPGD